MAKVQKVPKGFQLPEEVVEWLEREEWNTGASYSRIALAAFCAYKLATDSQRREFMQAAVTVEKGHWAFKNLMHHKIAADIQRIQNCLKAEGTKEKRELQKAFLEEAQEELKKLGPPL